MRSVLTDGAKAKQELEREIERRREELRRLEERLGRWEAEYAHSRLREGRRHSRLRAPARSQTCAFGP